MDPKTQEQIGEAFNDVFRHIEDWSYDELAEGFRAIEQRFRWLASLEPAAFLEIERRVAEDVLLMAEDSGQPIEHCEALLQRVLALGWTDRYRAAEVLLPFVRRSMEAGQPALALRYLEPVARDLESISPEPTKELLHTNLLASVRRVLQQLTVSKFGE